MLEAMRRVITVEAPAKVNMALAVGAPADDGMHPICSWMVTVDLVDVLEVTRLEDDRLSRYAVLWHEEARRRSEIDWPITRDLAVRAHLALEERTGERLPVQMKLEKRIPVAGGLGGGSSDAAAMLGAINELFDLALSDDELRVVAAGLGSDVPFFVSGGSAIVEGYGDELNHHEAWPELDLVIVFCESTCPTGHVYREFDELDPGSLRVAEVKSLAELGAAAPPSALFNDLTDAAMRIAPELAELLPRVSALADRAALVAGSGSSMFVLCDDRLHAEFLARTISEQLGLAAIPTTTRKVCDVVTE